MNTNQSEFKLSWKFFGCYSVKGLAWFRVFGWGLFVKDTRSHPLLFSQRNGLKGREVGNYYLEILKP